LLIADSTSRWAEALRDIAGRMEEMPAEEGFPPYLASRLAEYYERAGRARVPGRPERVGSVTIASAVSPPGGDFSEPVTSHTRRFVRVFWALDARLAYARHYPAINWLVSYSLYVDTVAKWWHENISPKWKEYRDEMMNILLREDELKEIVRLVGPESLSEPDKLIIETARIIKEAFLQQNAFDPIDAFCAPKKQFIMMKIIIDFYRKAKELVSKGVTVKQIREAVKDEVAELIRSRFTVKNDELDKLEKLYARFIEKLEALAP
jgi:V/A-type H+-transporting ATPase subunit A